MVLLQFVTLHARDCTLDCNASSTLSCRACTHLFVFARGHTLCVAWAVPNRGIIGNCTQMFDGIRLYSLGLGKVGTLPLSQPLLFLDLGASA